VRSPHRRGILADRVSDEIPAEMQLGCVSIGRNEGERLRRCLESVRLGTPNIVYVDSGSSDGSIDVARALGCDVVELDLSIPFTAARARNAGLRRLLQTKPGTALVQFVDGDCEVTSGWFQAAAARFAGRPELAVVCGRRRERYPDRSIYNLLCDVEWDTPIGEARACGGDAMMRVSSLEAVGGYNENLIAGEEPELCVRLRKAGYHIERIAAEMTLHDAAMTRMAQWWKRNVRSGFAYAEGSAMHGEAPERHFVREHRRAWLWAAVLPAFILLTAIPTRGASFVLLGGYVVSALRAGRSSIKRGRSRHDAALAAAFMTLGKFPELQGILRYNWARLRGRRVGLIEYKDPARP
jgi:GT2 family glycosyltransferase